MFQPLKKRIAITLDQDILDAVDKEKSSVGRSRSNYINHVLRCVLLDNVDEAGDAVRGENAV